MSRLRSEATAVARLQHPNIVQIYDIGEHDGLPYYSMEYIKGGNLKKTLDGKPLPPSLAASMIQDIATGVQYAHDQGIIHRDLKPDNILITNFEFRNSDANEKKSDGPSSVRNPKFAIPKITDFGIAKNLNAGSAQTQTGAILGTPSYMSPEQFTDSRKVGPPADIYALGAILYEMLTGRPPFTGVSTTEAFRVACQEEPTSPRKLQPGVPADLETICLKCLAKSPSARYANAQAMVEDLQRFRQGQPIQAKPISNVERVWKWARRYPAATMMSIISVLPAAATVFESRRLTIRHW